MAVHALRETFIQTAGYVMWQFMPSVTLSLRQQGLSCGSSCDTFTQTAGYVMWHFTQTAGSVMWQFM